MQLSLVSTRLALLWLVFCTPLPTRSAPIGWHPEVIQYTSKNGLPTSMIFKVLEDRQGYIWLGTNHGAVRYDGHSFQTYTTRDGLVDNTIIDIVEDYQGRLWFLSLSKKLCYFQHERIHSPACNPQLEQTLESRPSKIFIEENGTIWLAPLERDVLYRCNQDTVEKIWWQRDSIFVDGNYYCRKIGNNWVTLTTVQSISAALPPYPADRYRKEQQARLVAWGNDRYCLDIPPSPEGTYYYSTQLRNGSVLAWDSFRLLLFTNSENARIPYTSPAGNLNSVAEDSTGDLWLITKDGALRYRNGNLQNSIPEHFLPNTFITAILRDRSGNYWFSSWDNGLFHIPGVQFRSLRLPSSSGDNAITSIKVYDDRIWLLSTRGNVYVLDNDSVPQLVIDGEKVLAPNPESVDFMQDGKGQFWVGQNVQMVTPLPNKKYRARTLPVAAAKIFLPLRNGTTAIGTANGFSVYGKNATQVFSSSKLSPPFFERTNAIAEAPDGTLWLGSISGLYRYHNGAISYQGDANPLLKNRVSTINQMQDGTLVLGTWGAGVLLKKGEAVQQINIDSGLTSDIIRSMYVDEFGTIWAGTNKGLNRITLHSKSPLRYSILSWTTAKGLPSNAINAIVKHRDELWLATDDGLCRFNPDSVDRNYSPLPVHITGVEVNGVSMQRQDGYELPWDSNNVTISFIGVGFRTAGDIRYRYRLLGLGADTAWHETVSRTIPFLALDPGTYRFQVSAINEDGVWSPVPQQVQLTIAPHYSQTLWFQAGMVLLSTLLLGTGVWWAVQGMRKRDAINAQIHELRHQALRANMNPHFISNALSVIQDYVTRNNPEEANDFLVRFSRLIRLTLETSQNSFVPLVEELERLELYLSLERIRFGCKLDYRITIDNRIDTHNTPVPSMIVQPYVENAIWHGILPLEGSGLVEVEIKLVEHGRKEVRGRSSNRGSKSYAIVIRDNGIGLSAAKHRKRSSRKSFSMALNQERLRLLAKSLRRPFGITVSDRAESPEQHSDNGRGTVVEILLPTDIPDIEF